MGNLVVKDNALVEASHRLGEVEQRLVLLAILKAREYCDSVEQLKGKELIIYADDYAKIYGINLQMAYKALKQAVIGLFEAKWGYKYINNKGNIVVCYERFTQSAKYIEGEGSVSFRFADLIIPMLVALERNFTAYEIEQIANLSSRYAMRLYEFFMQYLDKKTNKGWLDIKLDDLRFRLGLLPTEYKRMCDFKRDVLELSLKQINENTDLTVSYTQKKQGRTIVGFSFKFTVKTKPKTVKTTKTTAQLQEPKRDPKTVDLFDGLTDLERQAIQNKIDEHIIRLERNGDIVGDFHRQNITKKAINERWGVDVALKKQALEQAEQERLAKEQAKKLADEQAKQEQAKKAEQRRNAMIAKFESLSFDEQEQILDEVGTFYKDNVFEKWFVMAREQRTAHKDVMFMSYFFKVLDM